MYFVWQNGNFYASINLKNLCVVWFILYDAYIPLSTINGISYPELEAQTSNKEYCRKLIKFLLINFYFQSIFNLFDFQKILKTRGLVSVIFFYFLFKFMLRIHKSWIKILDEIAIYLLWTHSFFPWVRNVATENFKDWSFQFQMKETMTE